MKRECVVTALVACIQLDSFLPPLYLCADPERSLSPLCACPDKQRDEILATIPRMLSLQTAMSLVCACFGLHLLVKRLRI